MRGGPFLLDGYGASTRCGKMIDLHVLKWRDGKLVLPAIAATVLGASTLTGGDVHFAQTERGIAVSVPLTARDDIDTVIALPLDASAAAIQPVK